jgi:ATP-dependent RNA helicase RhlE
LLTSEALLSTPSFADFDLIPPLRRAIDEAGYETPTPVQVQAIPALLDGRDLIGVAQTGSGKTLAFALPVLQHLASDPGPPGRRRIRALVLSPTRELAAQIGERFEVYGEYTGLRHLVLFGGVKQGAQVRALHRGVDVLVATPGRLLDLHGQGHLNFDDVEYFVLDEADRMLDMGFIHDLRRIVEKLPPDRQNLMFSATMPPPIARLAASFLRRPLRVDVSPKSTTVDTVQQRVCFVEKANKKRLLAHFLRTLDVDSCIVFTRTKHGANRLTKQLDRFGFRATAIHGNKSQNARQRALNAFKDGSIPILVATDVASRGIDVHGISHIFNYDLPNEPESYVHRIGRTARAGRDGVAIAFCDESEGAYLRDIERLIRQRIPVDAEHEFHFPAAIPPLPLANRARGGSRPTGEPDRGDGPPRRHRGRGRGRGGWRSGSKGRGPNRR